MKLSTSLVAVKKVTASSSRFDFDDLQIEKLAQQILKAEGIIRPLIIQRTSLQSYEVVEGHFEYHSAVRAREIDPRKGEMISAYIIETENEDVSEAIVEQIQLLNQSTSTNSLSKPDVIQNKMPQKKTEVSQSHEITKSILSKLSDFEFLLNSLQKSLTKVVEANEQIKSIKTSSNDSSEFKLDESSLEILIDKVIEKYIAKTKSSKSSSINSKATLYTPEKEKAIIDGLNTFDASQITDKLLQAGYANITAKNLANKVCEYRRIVAYKSIEDLMSREDSKGKPFFVKTTLTKLIKIW